MTKKLLIFFTLALAAVVPARAVIVYPTTYYTQYVVDLTGPLAVDGIVTFDRTATGGSVSWPSFLSGGSTTVLEDVFGSPEPRISALLMGVAYDGYPNIE